MYQYLDKNYEYSHQNANLKKTILITGAGSGLGRGAAINLAKQNYNIIAGVEIWPQYTSLKEEANRLNLKMDIVKLDITNKEEREKVYKMYGKFVDILVNNAAIGETGPIAEIPVDNFRKNMEVNVFSTLELTQLFVKEFVRKRSGKIIFISSIAGIKTFPFFGPYCATKFALEAVASSLYDELKPYGVNVCTINPGPYKTGFNDRMFDTKEIWYSEQDNFTNRQDFKPLEMFLKNGQYNPDEMIDFMVRTIPLDNNRYRLVDSKKPDMIRDGLTSQKDLWTRQM